MHMLFVCDLFQCFAFAYINDWSQKTFHLWRHAWSEAKTRLYERGGNKMDWIALIELLQVLYSIGESTIVFD